MLFFSVFPLTKVWMVPKVPLNVIKFLLYTSVEVPSTYISHILTPNRYTFLPE